MPKPSWIPKVGPKKASTAGTRTARYGPQYQDKGDRFSPLMAKLLWKTISNAPSMEGALERARILWSAAYYWIQEYADDYPLFKTDWMVLRNSLPLQARLVVEQQLWNLGEPWKRLVTGFNAID
jgi:hypothetical protein